MEGLKVLVIGCGRIGAEPSTRLMGELPHGWLPISHLESWLSLLDPQNIAICDPIEAALLKCTSIYPVKQTFSDHRLAISEFIPDIISLATRTPEKSTIISDAIDLACPKGLYVEKPLANSLADASYILNSLNNFKCAFAYGANRRYHYLYKKAKRLIDEGIIGRIEQIIVEHGPAQLMWTHPHSADLIDFFTDSSPPVKISGQLYHQSVNNVSNLIVDSDPVVKWGVIELENGVQAIITSGKGHNIRIHGSKGILTVHSNGEFLTIYSPRFEDKYYYSDLVQYTGQLSDSSTVCAFKQLINSVENQTPNQGDYIMNGLVILMGLVWSHINNGAPIDTESIPFELTVTGKSEGRYA